MNGEWWSAIGGIHAHGIALPAWVDRSYFNACKMPGETLVPDDRAVEKVIDIGKSLLFLRRTAMAGTLCRVVVYMAFGFRATSIETE